MNRITTPHNTPRTGRSLDPDYRGGDATAMDPSIPIINGNVRVGGGFETSALGMGLLKEEDRRANEWRAMGGGGGTMYNPDLEKHLMERKTELYAANSFLFNKPALKSTAAPQIFEFTKASSVAHHLQQQPDHYSKLGGGGLSPNSRRPFSAGSGASTSSQARSRILSRFDPQHGQQGLVLNPTNAQFIGGAMQQTSGGALMLNASAATAAPHHYQQQHVGGGGPIYMPHSSFTPLVAAAPPSSPSAHIVVEHASVGRGVGPSPTRHAAAASIAAAVAANIGSPAAAVYNDTVTGIGSAGGASAIPAAAATSSLRAVSPPTSPSRGGGGGAGATAMMAASSGSVGDFSRHTVSSMGKTKANATVHGSQNLHPHSQSYIAAQQYESHIRQQTGVGNVSAIANTDALLDSLTAGEPDPHTGYVQPNEFKASNSSMLRVLKHSHHLIDRTMTRNGVRLGCCGSQSANGNLVPAAGSKVDGLFVTYCQQDVHSQLEETKRTLVHEQGQREYDQDVFNERLAAVLHENQRLKQQLHEATVIADARFEQMGQQLKDALELKEEYDRRAEEAKKKLAETLAERSHERDTITLLTNDNEAKDKKILELQVKLFDTEKCLQVAEKQVQDVYRATTLATEEKMAAEGKSMQLEKQVKDLGVMLMNANKAYQGSELSRQFAEDKIQQMAFLMSTGQQRVKSTKAAKN